MLDIQTSYIDGVAVMNIRGRIDAINASQLQLAIDSILHQGQGHHLLLIMRDVNYLSAAGLRILRNLMRQTGTVRISEPSDRVIEVMQITGLDALYSFYPTLADGIHAVQKA